MYPTRLYITALHWWVYAPLPKVTQNLFPNRSQILFEALCSITLSAHKMGKHKHPRTKNRLAMTHGFATKSSVWCSCHPHVFVRPFTTFTCIPYDTSAWVIIHLKDNDSNPLATVCYFWAGCPSRWGLCFADWTTWILESSLQQTEEWRELWRRYVEERITKKIKCRPEHTVSGGSSQLKLAQFLSLLLLLVYFLKNFQLYNCKFLTWLGLW